VCTSTHVIKRVLTPGQVAGWVGHERDSFDRKKRWTKDRGIAPEHKSNFSFNGFRLVNIIIVYNKHLKVGYMGMVGRDSFDRKKRWAKDRAAEG